MSERLTIRLLGKPALQRGGAVVPFAQPPKAFAMLAYLIVHRERPVRRASLAELFWPDDDLETALANVRRYLHRIGSGLPASDVPYLIADKRELRWNPDVPVDVDVVEFEHALSASDVERAADLYGGDFLEGFDEDWALTERERLRELFIASLVDAIEAQRTEGRLNDAIRLSQRLTQCDPLREDAVRQVMLMRFESGDRAGAIAEFERFERRLGFELGAEPMPETRAVYEALRRGRAPPGAWVSHNAPEGARRQPLPFVGRADALRELRRALDRAARGSVRIALVTGEAGIGKTRLLQELIATAQTQGVRVASGYTSPVESEPFQAIATALRSALPYVKVEELGVGAAALAELVPELRDFHPEIGTAPELEPERARTRLFEAVRQAYAQLGRDRPALIVFEDLHWARESTLAEVGALARRLGGSALIVMTVRENDPGAAAALRMFERIAPGELGMRLPLRALTFEDLKALVARLEPATTDSEQRARELLVRSDGNPLFVSQLVHGGISSAQVPAAVSDVVLHQVAALTPRGRGLLQNAAVLGVGFELELLRRTSAWTLADVLDALDELLDVALLRESIERRDEFAFSHHLVHEAAYGSIATSTRRRLHRRAARALESLLGSRAVEQAAVIARHYDEARAAKAVEWYETAGRRALAVFANDDAIALATRGLELADAAARRFALLKLRETALGFLARRDEQRDDCAAMLELARDESNSDWECEAWHLSANLAHEQGATESEAQAVERLESLARASGDSRRTVEASALRARALINAGRAADALATLCKIESIVASIDDPSLAVDYWWDRVFAASTLRAMSEAEAALAHMHAAVAAGPRRADPRLFRAAAIIAQQRFDAEALKRSADEALELYEQAGDIEGIAFAHQHLALAAWERFDLDAHRAHLAESLALNERIDKPSGIYTVTVNRGVAAIQLGLFEEATRDFQRGAELGALHGRPHWVAISRLNLGYAMLARGEPAEAASLARQVLADTAFASDRVHEAVALDLLGSAERDLGDLEGALRNLEAAAAAHRELQSDLVVGPLSELIPAYLTTGRVVDAAAAADELGPLLVAKPSALTFPSVAFARVIEAYSADGRDREARAYRERGVAFLRERSSAIPDERTRRAFLAIPGHAPLVASMTAAGVDAAGTAAR